MSENLSIIINTILASAKESNLDGQIKVLSAQIKEKLSVKLQIDASQLSVITSKIEEANKKINNASKAAISKADQGAMYEQVKSKIAQLGTEMKKNGAQLLEWTAQTKAKTGEITGATIKYADSLGRVKTELYSVVKTYEKLRDENNKIITDKKGNAKQVLSSIDLTNTTNTYSQNIGASQREYFTQAKTELGIIQGLKKEQFKIDDKESELYKLLNQQIATHEKTLNEILATKIKISKTDDTSAVSVRQQTALNKIIKNNNDELDRLKTKQGQTSSKSTTSSSVSTGNLKDVDLNIQRINNSLNTLKVNKDKVFADSRVVTEVGKLKEMETLYKKGSISLKEYQTQMGTLRSKVAQVAGEFKNVNKDGYSFTEMLGMAGKKIAIWGISTSLIYGSLSKLREGVTFLNDLNKSMTNIAMITGKSHEDIIVMTKDYVNLAKTLHDTIGSVQQASEEFLRAGNNQQETLALLQSSTVMSKIAGQDQKSTADQLIAITNAYKLNAEQTMSVVDKLTAVDNASATSTRELGTAIERTASSAQLAGASFDELVSYIATVSSVSRKSASSIGESFNVGGIAA